MSALHDTPKPEGEATGEAEAELVALAVKPGMVAAVARPRASDGSTPTESVEAPIHAIWPSRMIARVIDAPFDPLPKTGDQDSVAAPRNMLDDFETNGGVGTSGIDFFTAPGIAAAAAGVARRNPGPAA